MKQEYKRFIPLLLIVILGFVIYYNSLNGMFVWDDELLIGQNEYIRNITDARGITGLFTKHIAYGTDMQSNFYRPLQMLTYVLNYQAGKINPVGYHLVNVFFHISVALTLYWLTLLLFRNSALSLIAGLLFVSHPIHTEAVAYISGRADPMAALFMLSTVAFYVKYLQNEKKRKLYILSITSFILALVSKEIAFVTPFLLLAYDSVYKTKTSFRRYVPFFSIGIIYAILRKTILSFPATSLGYQSTLGQRAPAIFSAITGYFQKILFPRDLHMEYRLVVPAPNNPKVIIGIAIIFILVFIAVRCRKKERLVTFSIAWFFVNYLPISNIYPLNALFAEHWIYIPSIGLFTLAGWIAVKVFEKGRAFKMLAILFIAILLAAGSYLTIRQNMHWREPVAFYQRTLKYNPKSQRVYHSLSLFYFINGKIDKGVEAAKKALEIDPNYADVHANLTNAYLLKGLYGKAAEEGKKAIAIDPNHANAHHNLAVAYYNLGKHDLAVKHCRKTVELGHRINPRLLEFYKSYQK